MATIARLLSSPDTDTAAALAQAEQGVAHAIRPQYTEQRPETWLLCAVAELLKAPEALAAMGSNGDAVAKLPLFEELSGWVDLLGEIGQELTGDSEAVPPANGTEAATLRALKLQMLRLWLLGALNIRLQCDAGSPVSNDPDAMPIGAAPGPVVAAR